MNTLKLINDHSKAHADHVLAAYYDNKFISPEKKTYLTKHSENFGPYLAIESKNDETQYLLDAASQIATLGLGFSPAPLMGTAHYQSSFLNDPSLPEFKKLSFQFDDFLKSKLGWCHLESTYCNSGAEANEIALGYAYKRRVNKSAHKVLAFEGSFHGRMMVSLSSTWNKTKREPFQWEGYETIFTPYPENHDHNITKVIPDGWHACWDSASNKNFKLPKIWDQDEELALEAKCLEAVREQLLQGQIFAILIEPMQCEGGDRYSTNRFHTGLLLLARTFNVPVIYDEVQTGFHLGTSFFWHSYFDLTDANGVMLAPDYVVCAKKAQVGMVLSPKPLNKDLLEKQMQFSCASVVRGFLHAMALDQSRDKIKLLEEMSLRKLNELVEEHKIELTRPRAQGLAFAFDVIDATKVSEYISKRFEHGLLYYPAGTKTLRFRLNTSFSENDVDYLFDSLRAITDEIFHGKQGQKKNSMQVNRAPHKSIDLWQQTLLALRSDSKSFSETEILSALSKGTGLQAIIIDKKNFQQYKDDIIALEQTYEKTRQTDISRFEICVNSPVNICLALKDDKGLEAITFASDIADHPFERGLRMDPSFGQENVLYVIDTTVTRKFQGQGLGRQLKSAMTALALIKGYHFIKGRNRDQLAAQMMKINLSLGATCEFRLKEDYPDHEEYRDVLYYGIPLTWNKKHLNLSNRINSRLGNENLSTDFITTERPYIVNKVCLSNFVSERYLSHLKEISEVMPENLRHCYSASGQSECVDKVAKSILYHRKNQINHKSKMVTFKGHYFGNGSFLSRSLSCADSSFFPTLHLDTPTQDNGEKIIAQIMDLIEKKEVFAIWLEPVLQKTFQQTPRSFIEGLLSLCQDNNIPVVFNDTASCDYNYDEEHYSGASCFSRTPDASMSFLGGQAGIVCLTEELFIEKPLMMISTWDGDEYSYSSFVTSLRQFQKNKEEMFKLRETFHDKMKSILDKFEGINYLLRNGRGIVQGNIPYGLRRLLSQRHGEYVIDPCPEAMKNFILQS